MHPLQKSHETFCNFFAQYHKCTLREKSYGMIKISLPQRVLKVAPPVDKSVEETMKLLYKNVTAFKDECVKAALMDVASYPLTAFYALELCEINFPEQALTMHIVGMFAKISLTTNATFR